MMNIDEAGDEYLCVEAAVVAKSSIVLDVKPWDDETDMAEIERCVRSVETDGLLWGNCELLTFLLLDIVAQIHWINGTGVSLGRCSL